MLWLCALGAAGMPFYALLVAALTWSPAALSLQAQGTLAPSCATLVCRPELQSSVPAALSIA